MLLSQGGGGCCVAEPVSVISLDISLKYVEITPRTTTTSPTRMTITPASIPPRLVPVVLNCAVFGLYVMLTDDAIIVPPATAISPPMIAQRIMNKMNLMP